MKIKRFWAREYRSLRDVDLDDLGPFNVFYGPNGSGKSNVLRGITTLLRAAELWAGYERPGRSRFARSLVAAGVLSADDRHQGNGSGASRCTLGVEVIADEDPVDLLLSVGRTVHQQVTIELSIDWNDRQPFEAGLDVRFDGVAADAVESDAVATEPGASVRAAIARIASGLFWTVGADRALRDERLSLDPSSPPNRAVEGGADAVVREDAILDALREGRLQTAIFHAKNDWDRANRHRFGMLQSIISETVALPPLDVGRDPATGLIDLRQPLSSAGDEGDISMRSAGLGIEQIVAIVASILFSRCRVVAVEEPEAHLHAPTTGRALRRLLKQLVEPEGESPRVVHQLFVATHSNLFDLDPRGYFDVSLQGGATVIVRKPLHELYAHHLYEPGPARILLMEALSQFGDEVVFRTQEGERISTQEMVKRLSEDDAVALEFVRDMHAAALATLRVRANRAPKGKA